MCEGRRVLGLPDTVTALLFDLDGVLTDTASVHNRAWARMFDEFLRTRSQRTGEPFVPFDPGVDYPAHVDGKPRQDGVRDFLASRGIHLPEGTPDDPPDAQTVHGLGNRKNALFNDVLRDEGVDVFDSSVHYLRAAAAAGLRRAVVSSSANTAGILEVTGMAPLVETRVDGLTIREENLAGKPAPDSFLLAATRLGVAPENAAVFEDALSGVAAGRAGGFGIVVGVDRVGGEHGARLRDNGADIVVRDLGELL
jgi:beta-phosphoglucomutase family hydrolase